jgi:hypothetical protein
MISFRRLLMPSLSVLLFYSAGMAQDMARYRDFQFGMSPEAVAAQMQINPSAIRTTHLRPALIQTFQWDKPGYSETGTKNKSLRSIRFDFYNGELSKIVVTYDPGGTNGLTTDDMIEAISALYGPAAKPDRTIAVSASSVYPDNQTVLASWDDAQYSYNLFRSEYGNTFGLVGLSKRLDLMASVSVREADRLDTLEGPEKERALQLKQEADRRAAQEKARLVNKPSFRP